MPPDAVVPDSGTLTLFSGVHKISEIRKSSGPGGLPVKTSSTTYVIGSSAKDLSEFGTSQFLIDPMTWSTLQVAKHWLLIERVRVIEFFKSAPAHKILVTT